MLGWLALVNVGLFVFNLIPAFPLDGGRIAKAIAWKLTGDRNRGTRFSARLGQAFSYILMGLGIVLLVRGDAGSGIWWILMGWFLGQSATGAVVSSRFSERLEGVTVADVMDTQPVWVPGDTTVLQAQDEFFLRYRWPWFPVADATSGRFLGLLHQHRVDGAVQDGRPALVVADVVDADGDEAFRVHDDTPIEQLMGSEGLRSLGALMVIDRDDRLRGVVTLEQVRRALAAAAPGGSHDRFEAVGDGVGVVSELAPGEAQHVVARGGEGGVLGAVIFEGVSCLVGVPAVGFDDEAVRREVEVGLEAWVVGGVEGVCCTRVAAGRARGRACACGSPARCATTAGRSRSLLARRPVPRWPLALAIVVLDRGVVVELQAFGLRQRSLEVVVWGVGGDVEQRAVAPS